MDSTQYVALGGLITIIASSCALIIKTLQSSKCVSIKLCGVECNRKLDVAEPSPKP